MQKLTRILLVIFSLHLFLNQTIAHGYSHSETAQTTQYSETKNFQTKASSQHTAQIDFDQSYSIETLQVNYGSACCDDDDELDFKFISLYSKHSFNIMNLSSMNSTLFVSEQIFPI